MYESCLPELQIVMRVYINLEWKMDALKESSEHITPKVFATLSFIYLNFFHVRANLIRVRHLMLVKE